jgi:hypothetical protein
MKRANSTVSSAVIVRSSASDTASRIRAQAKDRCVLSRERLSQRGAVREVSMRNLFQLGCEMPMLLRPIDVTRSTASFSSA